MCLGCCGVSDIGALIRRLLCCAVGQGETRCSPHRIGNGPSARAFLIPADTEDTIDE